MYLSPESLPSDIDLELSGYGEIADIEVIAELAWDGLKKSVAEGFRTQQEAEKLFYEWFSKRSASEDE